jgi:hypothetical protein
MAEGATLFMFGVILGVVITLFVQGERDKRHRKKLADAPKPVCTCGHARGMHRDGGKGECAVSTYMSVMASKGLKCPCLMYDGPIPLPEYYSPEITG